MKLLNLKNEKAENCHLCAVSLTQGDQEIWMKTERDRVMNHHDHDTHPIEIVERKTLS